MRIIVFSDSHGNYSALQTAVLAQPEGDVYLHLGDGMREFETLQNRFPDKKMLCVTGNCDWGLTGDKYAEIVCGGKRIFFTHGHFHNVKGGLDRLIRVAQNAQADILLYGHTHVSHTSYYNGLYVMNPGSVSMPRDGPACYGMIDITPAGVAMSIVPINGRRMP